MSIRAFIIEIITVLFIILWAYMGLSKLFEIELFGFQPEQFSYTGELSGSAGAWMLPVGELAIALMLLIKPFRQIGLYASFFTMLLFTGYIAILNFSHHTPYRYEGIFSGFLWKSHLILNIVFTSLSLIAVQLSADKPKTDRKLPNDHYFMK